MGKLQKSLASVIASVPLAAMAGPCDHTPSKYIGAFLAGAGSGFAGAVAVAGTSLKAAGFYTLPHAITGATMLGSTAGGASAAGTVGIMGGTAGAIGTTAAILMTPAVIATGAVVAGGVAAFEGTCYYIEKK